MLVVGLWFGRKNRAVLARIESGCAPALELSLDLNEQLSAIQRLFQDSVASEDVDGLAQADAARAAVLARKTARARTPPWTPGGSRRCADRWTIIPARQAC